MFRKQEKSRKQKIESWQNTLIIFFSLVFGLFFLGSTGLFTYFWLALMLIYFIAYQYFRKQYDRKYKKQEALLF